MKKNKKATSLLFCLFMLLFCAALAAMTVLRAQTDFQLEDVARSLETSRGRERKQQAEYEEAAAELPRVRAELAKVQPLADAAEREAAELKEKRKALREEKKAREQTPSGETGGETP